MIYDSAGRFPRSRCSRAGSGCAAGRPSSTTCCAHNPITRNDPDFMLLTRTVHLSRVAFQKLPIAGGAGDVGEVVHDCFAPKTNPFVNAGPTRMNGSEAEREHLPCSPASYWGLERRRYLPVSGCSRRDAGSRAASPDPFRSKSHTRTGNPRAWLLTAKHKTTK